MSFRIERADGASRQVSGYRAGSKRDGAQSYRASSAQKLPPKVDLRSYMTRVEDQSELNSCVANAVVGAYEYLAKRHHGDESMDVSRLFVYYNARLQQGWEEEDEGAEIVDAIESLKEYGACSEETWPYDEDMVNEEPSQEAYDEASWFVVEDMKRVRTKIDLWKQALAEGYPIIFALKLYNSFDKHKKRGLVPVPGKREAGREEHGGHAMLCVGYSDPDRVFIVRNSWGSSWGDKGYCYIPYDYLMSDEFNYDDSWIIRQVEPLVFDEETWGDEESLLEDMQTVLSNMDDETYQALLDDLGDIPLETRLAHLMLMAAGADGDISEEEIDEISTFLGEILEILGSELSAKKVLKHAMRLLDDEESELLEETLAIFANHFSAEQLAGFTDQIAQVASADDASQDEIDFLNAIIQAWQITDYGEYDDAEEGDEEEDEEEDDEEE